MIHKDFIESRVSTLPFVPEEWEVGSRHGYKLDLKMCQIKALVYDFTWADDERCVQICKVITDLEPFFLNMYNSEIWDINIYVCVILGKHIFVKFQ